MDVPARRPASRKNGFDAIAAARRDSGAASAADAPGFELESELWRAGRLRIAGVDEAGRGPLAGPVVAAAVILPREGSPAGIDDSKKLSPERRAALAAGIWRTALAVGVGLAEAEEIDRINIRQASLMAMVRAVAGLQAPQGDWEPAAAVAHDAFSAAAVAHDAFSAAAAPEPAGSSPRLRPALPETAPPRESGPGTARRSQPAPPDPIPSNPILPDYILVDGRDLPDGLSAPGRAIIRGDAVSLSIAAASIIAKETRDAIMTALARRHPGYGWERNRGYPTAEHLQALTRLGIASPHRRRFGPVRRLLETL